MGSCLSSSTGRFNPNKGINLSKFLIVIVDETHFDLLKVVGKGGFGKVNAVSEKRTGQLYAMKRMRKTQIAKSLHHVQREVMAIAKSPFNVNLVYAFQSKKSVFFIMPFLRGGDLNWYLTQHRAMKEDMARFYAAETLLALEELHKHRIVYRDLKPCNLLLDDLGHCRLSDFGLAWFLREEDKYKTKGVCGTRGYMAPEVLMGLHYNTSPDFWAFGITLYEFIHCSLPFHDEELDKPEAVTHLHFRHSCGSDTRDLIRKLLAYKASINWNKMNAKEYPPPFQPNLEIANCSSTFELQDQFFAAEEDELDQPLEPEQQKLFERLDFRNVLENGKIVEQPEQTFDLMTMKLFWKPQEDQLHSVVKQNTSVIGDGEPYVGKTSIHVGNVVIDPILNEENKDASLTPLNEEVKDSKKDKKEDKNEKNKPKEEAKLAEPPKEEVEQEEPPKEEAKPAEPPKEEIKQEEPPKEEVRQEEPPKEEAKPAEPPKEEIKQEEPPKEEVRQEEPPKEEVRQEEPPKEEIKQEEPPKEEVRQEEPPKEEI